MSKLAEYGLTIETTAKGKCWLRRNGLGIKITALQRDLLNWLDGATEPSLAACCDALWEQVEPEWVRSQWDRVASLMTPLGAAALMDDSDTLFFALVDAEGAPQQPVLKESPSTIPVFQSSDGEPWDNTDRCLWLEGRLNAAEAYAEKLKREIAEYREAAEGQLIIVNQAKEALAERDRLLDQVSKLKEVNDTLATMRREALDQLGAAEDEIKRLRHVQPSAEIVQLRDYPAKIAPYYLTVPVSEVLFRWLEASGDRNRRSADDMARVLPVAFMRSTGNREAA